jgi:hypothetical protein
MTTEARPDTATDQVAAYVADFNHGVRTRDWEPMIARFAPDAELEFVGLGVPALVGHDAMRAAYAEQGPDDEIELLGTRREGDAVIARYAWVRGEGTGELRLEPGS